MMMNGIIEDPRIINIDFEEQLINANFTEEIWENRTPKKGDHIRVKRIGGLYAHHGIYVSDDEVIHFTGRDNDSVLDWSKCEVLKSDLLYFLKDGILEVKEYTEEEFKDLYSPEQIVTYARSCIGDKKYHLVFNNCEHFANVCTLGRFRSQQVERVFMGKLPNEEEKEMGLFGAIGGFLKSLFDGGSSGGGGRTTTTYEPDKVKIAEIESETKIRLANMEMERIELMKQARLEMLELETKSQLALEQAKLQELSEMTQIIINMQDRLNDVAEKRLQIIEKGSIQIIKEIESFYNEVGNKIKEDNEKYNREKLPALLDILGQYEENSPAYQIYFQQIQDDRKLQLKHYNMQIEAVEQRQLRIIDGLISSKEKVIEQTGKITQGMLDAVQNQMLQLSSSMSNSSMSNSSVTFALPKEERLALSLNEEAKSE
ncbi:MAG: lecithin retinol acyltransferase family protein [Lachnospiraceae bacterium]